MGITKRVTRVAMLAITTAVAGVAAAESAVPAWLVRLPESVPTVFVAVTDSAEFHRYDRGPNGIELTASYYVSIGRNGPGKERSGDRRTPIGAYFVTEQLDTTRLHEKYGATAFPLDYPNEWDRLLARTGDGIWVHGVDPNGGRRPERDTDGCLALPNEDLLSLESLFENGRTPVLIGESLPAATEEQRRLVAEQLERAVMQWASSLADGDLHTHLSLYSDSFERWSMNRDEWAAFVVQTSAERPISSIGVDELLLLGYPGEDGLYLSRFRQLTTGREKVTETIKRLYWRRDEHGAYRIVAEDNG